MNRILALLIAFLGCAAILVVGSQAAFPLQDVPKESKVQPKDVVLGKDSQSDKYGEVAFSHENHSTKNYSIDGKAVIAVRHAITRQPASGRKPR